MQKVALALTLVVVAAACHEEPKGARSAPSPASAAPPATTPTVVTAAAPPRAARAVDPERVCIEVDGTIVVEHTCGCDDALLCEASQTSPEAIMVSVRKDESRLPMCTDCFPMVPGRCPLPTSASGPTLVRAGSLELSVALVAGKPATRTCAASRR